MPTTHSPQRVLALLCACVVLTIAMVAAINLAVPPIAAGPLHPTATQLLWIVDSYVIVFAGLLIPAGVAGDHYGHKRTMLAGLGILALGAVLCAAASAVPLLIAGRAVMGAGAALVLPATLAVLVHVFPPGERAQAIGTWASMTGLAGVLGNLGGGLLLQLLPWQSLFWVCAPAALLLLALVTAVVPATPLRGTRQDPVGSVLLVAGFLALLHGVIEGPSRGWGTPAALLSLAAAVLLLAAFVRYELRREHPMLDPRLFRLPAIRAGALGIGAVFFGMFALFYVNAQYLQQVKGFSVLATGFGVLPLAVGMLVVSRRSTALAARFGRLPVVATGFGCLLTGLLLLSTIGAGTPYPLYAAYQVLMAAGAGLTAPPLSAGIMAALPPRQAGLGSGINSSTRELGSALGVAAVGTAISTGPLGEGLAGGYRVVAAVVLVLGTAALSQLRRAA
ncbi:MFS transporter [Kitasatospora sp. NPDC096147]|uniref:MFS transporter n=1 Tax=Kitasatospora sp. NPDC096147 TaxID=3364093 RepID=UPI003819A2CB